MLSLSILLFSCSVSFPVVAAFDDYNEVFVGTGTSDLRGSGSVDVVGQVSKVRCTGVAHLISRSGGFGCAGQIGRCRIRCTDGRVADAEYVVTSCGSGYGSGQDRNGNRFWFTFGLSEEEARKVMERESKDAAARPPLPPPYRPGETRREKGYATGTGFFVTKDGYLLTNHHVVDGAKEITVVIAGGASLLARVIRADPANDVVLLKVEAVSDPLPLLSESGARGDEVFTLGYPLIALQGQDQKATFGRINSLSGFKDDVRYLQIDVPIQPGNSGGPLINTRGQVMGVVTATLDQLVTLRRSGALPQNVNYAVKIEYVMPLLRSHLGGTVPPSPLARTGTMSELVKLSEKSIALVIARQEQSVSPPSGGTPIRPAARSPEPTRPMAPDETARDAQRLKCEQMPQLCR